MHASSCYRQKRGAFFIQVLSRTLSLFFFQVMCQQSSSSKTDLSGVFSPIVTATCRAGMMTIKVENMHKFVGVVQSRDYRKPTCSGYGENAKVTFLRVNMLAEPEDEDYCGVFLHEVKSFLLTSTRL